MKIKWKSLLLAIAVPLAVGGLSSLFSGGGMQDFAAVEKPPLSPPGWLFPVVWTILYILMGIASYLTYTSEENCEAKKSGLVFYGLQLLFNFFWSIWFFRFDLYFFSFGWLVMLWILILITTILFSRVSKPAAYLMLPYLIWVTFAGYLNLGIALRN